MRRKPIILACIVTLVTGMIIAQHPAFATSSSIVFCVNSNGSVSLQKACAKNQTPLVINSGFYISGNIEFTNNVLGYTGIGFTPTRFSGSSAGAYSITFAVPFPTPPTCTVTPFTLDASMNCTIIESLGQLDRLDVACQDSTGFVDPAGFTFICAQ